MWRSSQVEQAVTCHYYLLQSELCAAKHTVLETV